MVNPTVTPSILKAPPSAVQRTSQRQSILSREPAQALSAALEGTAGLAMEDALQDGATLPLLWHWLYFNEFVSRSLTGRDGHKATPDLPTAIGHRRMWAAGRLRWHAPLVLGQTLGRRSNLLRIESKSGRGGDLTFVTLRHEVFDQARLLLEEEQDLVYLSAIRSTSAPVAPQASNDEQWCEPFQADAVLLFRYSALTSNSHRIHFDQSYAQQSEGYPGIVVQGPLVATLLMTALNHHMPRKRIRQMSFRAISPLFVVGVPEPFYLCGRSVPGGAHLWAKNEHGALAMRAEIEFAN